jgi:excinuclease UvrABC ATPase subunit
LFIVITINSHFSGFSFRGARFLAFCLLRPSSSEAFNILKTSKICGQSFSEKYACPVSGFQLAEIEPRIFSFNSPFGACPDCSGLGFKIEIDPELIIPNQNLSILEGAIRAPGFNNIAAEKSYNRWKQ